MRKFLINKLGKKVVLFASTFAIIGAAGGVEAHAFTKAPYNGDWDVSLQVGGPSSAQKSFKKRIAVHSSGYQTRCLKIKGSNDRYFDVIIGDAPGKITTTGYSKTYHPTWTGAQEILVTVKPKGSSSSYGNGQVGYPI